MSQFKKKLKAVFENGATLDGSEAFNHRARYVPKAISGGPSWRVFDQVDNRFLSDREIRNIPLETFKSATCATVH